jgi:hypothetical protein
MRSLRRPSAGPSPIKRRQDGSPIGHFADILARGAKHRLGELCRAAVREGHAKREPISGREVLLNQAAEVWRYLATITIRSRCLCSDAGLSWCEREQHPFSEAPATMATPDEMTF